MDERRRDSLGYFSLIFFFVFFILFYITFILFFFFYLFFFFTYFIYFIYFFINYYFLKTNIAFFAFKIWKNTITTKRIRRRVESKARVLKIRNRRRSKAKRTHTKNRKNNTFTDIRLENNFRSS